MRWLLGFVATVNFVLLPWLAWRYRLEHTGIYRMVAKLMKNTDKDKFNQHMKENDARIIQAEQYLLDFKERIQMRNSQGSSVEDTSLLRFLVVVVTQSRDNKYKHYSPKYLTQVSVGYLAALENLGVNQPQGQVVVCDVDTKRHEEAGSMSNYLQVTRVNNTEANNTLEKEKQDYVSCIKAALDMPDWDYLLMAEDDGLPSLDLFVVLQRLLLLAGDRIVNQMEEVNYRSALMSANQNIGIIKLYHPEHLLGYLNPEYHRWFEWLALSLLLTGVLFRLGMVSSMRRSQFLPIMVLIAVTIEMIGRYYYLELLRLIGFPELVPAPSCCTPAMLYNRRSALWITQELTLTTCRHGFGKDYAIWESVRSSSFRMMSVQPNYISHIGTISSIRFNSVS